MILDTHAALWFLQGSPCLSQHAAEAIQRLLAQGDRLRVSVISLVELTYLAEKGRLPADSLPLVERAIDQTGAFELVPFERAMVRSVERIPRDAVPDMPDRMIAATALHLNLPLVTADLRLRRAPLQTLW